MRILIACSILCAASLAAQNKKPASPHETVSADLGGHKVTIAYGRPYMKGRKIVGGLVPYGQVWRTGADEATKLTTDADLQIGSLTVPKGSYALFTLPSENGWKLIVNKTANQWGAFKYDQAQDLGRTDMTVGKTSAPVEQFTISLDKTDADSATLKMTWENTEAAVPVKLAHP